MTPNEDLPQGEREALEREQLRGRPSRARYDRVHAALEKRWRRRELKSDRMMREVVDALWDAFAGAPYSWCGFYALSPSGDELVLGPHRDRPGCSPLPMHGVCGKAAKSGEPQLVPDVAALGKDHIECDPKNRSEIALPVFDKDGKVWAVFDADSESLSAFDEMHLRWLERILKHFQEVGRTDRL